MASFEDTSGTQPSSLPSLTAFPVGQGGDFVEDLMWPGKTCWRWRFGRHRPRAWRMPRALVLGQPRVHARSHASTAIPEMIETLVLGATS